MGAVLAAGINWYFAAPACDIGCIPDELIVFFVRNVDECAALASTCTRFYRILGRNKYPADSPWWEPAVFWNTFGRREIYITGHGAAVVPKKDIYVRYTSDIYPARRVTTRLDPPTCALSFFTKDTQVIICCINCVVGRSHCSIDYFNKYIFCVMKPQTYAAFSAFCKKLKLGE